MVELPFFTLTLTSTHFHTHTHTIVVWGLVGRNSILSLNFPAVIIELAHLCTSPGPRSAAGIFDELEERGFGSKDTFKTRSDWTAWLEEVSATHPEGLPALRLEQIATPLRFSHRG